MTRKHAVTVRLPVASIAPTNKTVACSHTGLENSGANSTIRGNNSAGNVSIEGPLVAKVVFSLCCPPLLLQRAKMAKVELGRRRPRSPLTTAEFGLATAAHPV